MNKQQFKKLRHHARVCRGSDSFTHYGELLPIPEKLEPFLMPKPHPVEPRPLLELCQRAGKAPDGTFKHREWLRSWVRSNYTGVRQFK